jgi:hypothetical protein
VHDHEKDYSYVKTKKNTPHETCVHDVPKAPRTKWQIRRMMSGWGFLKNENRKGFVSSKHKEEWNAEK